MIHRLAKFEVKSEKLNASIPIIEEFVNKVNLNEPQCTLYRSLQEIDNPTQFVHYMIFESEEAETHHRQTPWVKEFVDRLYPILQVETVFAEMNVIGNG